MATQSRPETFRPDHTDPTDPTQSRFEQLAAQDNNSLREYYAARQLAREEVKRSIETSTALLATGVAVDAATEIAEGSVVAQPIAQIANLLEIFGNFPRDVLFNKDKKEISATLLDAYREAHHQGLITDHDLKAAERKLSQKPLKDLARFAGRQTAALGGYLLDLLPFEVGLSAFTVGEGLRRLELQRFRRLERQLDEKTGIKPPPTSNAPRRRLH